MLNSLLHRSTRLVTRGGQCNSARVRFTTSALLSRRSRPIYTVIHQRYNSTATSKPDYTDRKLVTSTSTISDAVGAFVNGNVAPFRQLYPQDTQTNITGSILGKMGRGLHRQPAHPLGIMAGLIRDYFGSTYAYYDAMSPIVSPAANFESLCFPPDHPGRSRSDSYYLNHDWMLRNDRFLLVADVYRRDEIDLCLFPQHQVETLDMRATAESPSNASDDNPRQTCYSPHDSMAVEEHLKASLEGMVRHIFDKAAQTTGDPSTASSNLKMRWVDAYFPFTSPSYELEILGCGVMQHSILERANRANSIGWAFGIGLERLAMALFRIPDIRLFWSVDPRFLDQFSRLANSFHPNDLFELVRDMAGDLVEDVKLVDKFTHPKTGRESHCYRIMYRSMDRNVTNEEINAIQERVREHAPQRLQVELR
ncbi:hypothetical protein BDF22DRAFT_693254 [Syncephalis plumigaleata]|nr:hypothetical protein BDF22DRAFT_693254 [Syncephalis plumigaleata]